MARRDSPICGEHRTSPGNHSIKYSRINVVLHVYSLVIIIKAMNMAIT